MSLILVVDDEPIVAELLLELCRGMGYDSKSCFDGQQALDVMRDCKPDLVLSDVNMPHMDGIKLLNEMSRSPELQEIPVIVISGLHLEERVVRCIELGAVDFLEKPINTVVLRARIEATLERTELRALAEEARTIKREEQIAKQMIGTICHNFNQPLTSAFGSMSTLHKCFEMIFKHIYGVEPGCNENPHTALSGCKRFDQFLSETAFKSAGDFDDFLSGSMTSLEESLRRISDLVNEAQCFVRPQRQTYVGDEDIIDLSASARHTVLLAEDDPHLLSIIAKRIKAAGYLVITASDGREAERHVRFSKPHIAVMDLNMPFAESVEEVFRLKHGSYLDMPVIVFSNSSPDAVKTISREYVSSANAYICKADEGAIDKVTEKIAELLGVKDRSACGGIASNE